MDKLKVFLAVLKKYQFWVTCGAILLIAIVCWWLATNGLASRFQQRKVKIERAFQSAIVEPKHPNQAMIAKIQEQHDLLKRNVFNAWQILFRKQKESNPIPAVLGANFKRQFEALGPKQELGRGALEDYQNFIKKYIPTLLTTGDILRPAEVKEPAAEGDAKAPGIGPAGNARRADAVLGDRRPGRLADAALGDPMPGETAGRNAVDEEEMVGTVIWNPADFHALEARFDLPQTPSTLAVVLAQEDLWVVEALLRVIRDTNHGATSNASAPVKQIDTLRIGREAVGLQQSTIRTGAGGPGAMLGRRGEMDGPGMAGVAAAAPSGAAGDEQRLVDGRYVDEKGNPVPSLPEYPYAQHPYAEFKMMPIRMVIVMDQRHLPNLLVACANSTMPIEVRRVQLLKTRGGMVDVTAAATAVGARGQGGLMRGGGFAENAVVRNTTEQQETATYDMPVEISGVIYIYNPPDREKLGTGTASTEKPIEPAVPGTAAPVEAGAPVAAPANAGSEAPAAATPAPGAPAQPTVPPTGTPPAGTPQP